MERCVTAARGLTTLMHHHNPKVSIIVPVYNGARLLPLCLRSIMEQRYQRYEVIVVDNHSTDATKQIIEHFQKKHHAVTYAYEPYRSRGAARNKGIEQVTGDIILMTDSDCIVSQHWIESLIAPIINEDENIVMGSQYDIVKNFWTRLIQQQQQSHMQHYRMGKYIAFLDTKNVAITTMLAKKIMFNAAIKNSEDFEFLLRIRDKYKIRFLPDCKVGHHHSMSLSAWIGNTFEKGYWTRKVFNKHTALMHHELMFESLRKGDTYRFFRNALHDFMYKPFSEAFFIFITGLSWRSGMLWGAL